MYLTAWQVVILVLAIAAGTFLTRCLPFVFFPEGRQLPAFVAYLGRMLPSAMLGLLVVYCLKGVVPSVFPHGLPELSAIAFIVLLHLYKRNVLLSIGLGTGVYMLLIRTVFAG